MRRYTTATLLFLWSIFAARPLHAGALRFRLPSAVTVSGDIVFLSHLLPSAAPESVRAAAANIPLGATPAAGASRAFTAAEISSAFSVAGVDFSAQPMIPEVVTV